MSVARTGPLSLAGRRILVTRPRSQSSVLTARLAALGAQPILFPTIEIAPLDDYAALDEALRHLDPFDWIIFTSANGVTAVWRRLEALGLAGLSGFSGRLAAIGPVTGQALEQRGRRAEFIPDEYVAEALAAGIGNVDGKQILLPRAEAARDVLTDELVRRGGRVHDLAAYRTLPAAPDPAGLAELRRGVDAITFTSSSTVRNFVALAGLGAPDPAAAPAVACIGPITAQTARQAGLPVDVVARQYSVDGLIAALVEYYQ